MRAQTTDAIGRLFNFALYKPKGRFPRWEEYYFYDFHLPCVRAISATADIHIYSNKEFDFHTYLTLPIILYTYC